MKSQTECKVCSGVFDTSNKFHRHLKKCCGKTQKEYYEEYIQRVDLLTLEPLEFKDAKSYFSTNFKNKENAIKWFKINSDEPLAKDLVTEYFKNKAFQKAPTQSELRCFKIPSIIGLDKIFGSYYLFCKTLGLKPRLVNRDVPKIKKVNVVTDTREQLPLFEGLVEKLEVGDYTIFEDFAGVFVERKSLEDFIGTFTRKENFERFERELGRAEALGLFLVVICEEDFENVACWKNPFAGGRSCGYSALSKMCQFMQKFDNCQFVFCKNGDPKNLVEKILGMGEFAKETDIQYLLDLKLI